MAALIIYIINNYKQNERKVQWMTVTPKGTRLKTFQNLCSMAISNCTLAIFDFMCEVFGALAFFETCSTDEIFLRRFVMTSSLNFDTSMYFDISCPSTNRSSCVWNVVLVSLCFMQWCSCVVWNQKPVYFAYQPKIVI